jgi:hypothetical protein
MGTPLNMSWDFTPSTTGNLYDACSIVGSRVRYRGHWGWDFSRLFDEPVDSRFIDLVTSYLEPIASPAVAYRGWKLPETTLIFPWLTRLLPEVKYIFWVRDPRDCILGQHGSDDLTDYKVEMPFTSDVYEMRAISWKYQYDIVKATPPPKHWLVLRYEDFILNTKAVLGTLEEFLGIRMKAVPTYAGRVGVWTETERPMVYPFLQTALREMNYGPSGIHVSRFRRVSSRFLHWLSISL